MLAVRLFLEGLSGLRHFAGVGHLRAGLNVFLKHASLFVAA